MPAWLLPNQVSDALPAEAWDLEHARRCLIDKAQRWGYEFVVPPMIGFLESLVVGGSAELHDNTVKFTDSMSGRQLGIRADMTPHIARIDAHSLNNGGVQR